MTVFTLMYGLIGMRESMTAKSEEPAPSQTFNPIQFGQDVAAQDAQNVRDGFHRTAEQQQ
jgi:hypothetical protein